MKGSIANKVYTGLRNSIIMLKMKPGEEININLITESLGVSRSPVRDALLELEKEGLVDILPQSGTRVSRINLERMYEEKFLRESLEEKTLEVFMTLYTDSDIHKLSLSLAAQKKNLEEKKFPSFLGHDDEFHRIFFEVANKTMCWDLIQRMSGHYRRVRLLNLHNMEIPSGILLQHTCLVDNIREGKPELAMETMKDHLSKIIFEERDLLREYPAYFTRRKNEDPFSIIQEGELHET